MILCQPSLRSIARTSPASSPAALGHERDTTSRLSRSTHASDRRSEHFSRHSSEGDIMLPLVLSGEDTVAAHLKRVFWHAARSTLILAVLALSRLASAQTTVSTGSIVGVVSDPTGAVISGAEVRITNAATKQVIGVQSNSSGSFNSGALIPGDYLVLISAQGFNSAQATVTVLVDNTSSVNLKLPIGNGKEVVEVQGSALQVNTEQPTVQGVL